MILSFDHDLIPICDCAFMKEGLFGLVFIAAQNSCHDVDGDNVGRQVVVAMIGVACGECGQEDNPTRESRVCGSKYHLGPFVAHVKHVLRGKHVQTPRKMLYMCYKGAQMIFGSAYSENRGHRALPYHLHNKATGCVVCAILFITFIRALSWRLLVLDIPLSRRMRSPSSTARARK